MAKRNIYWIGGSPCSGKSSIAEMLVAEYGFHYYKCDDYLEKYLEIASERNKTTALKMKGMDIDQTFLRPVAEQVTDEFSFYEEVFEIILEDLKSLDIDSDVIIEGAVLLPANVQKINVAKENYICIVPTAEFQLDKYSERGWVSHYLRESKDAKSAFSNWMQRDIEFAKIALNEASKLGYASILVDGKASLENNYNRVREIFMLKRNEVSNE